MGFFLSDMMQAPFWIGVLQIIGVNVILSGDNAVVIALACMQLPPRQRLWGMILGAGVAVLLRVVFTLVVAQAMEYPYLKLVGGLLLLWVAVKLVVPDEVDGDDKVEAAETLWRAVRIVAIADIVMSLDNVIAIAASAETAAARVDLAHAAAIKATLIIFGLATSVPLIIAGSAILMALLDRFPIFVWAGGGLLGWVAGDIMAKEGILITWLGPAVVEHAHIWAGRAGAVFVVGLGLLMLRWRRPLRTEEVLAGAAMCVWIVADILIQEGLADEYIRWAARGLVFVILILGYMIFRLRRAASVEEA